MFIVADDFARIEALLTPGKIGMISLVGVGDSLPLGNSLSVENRLTAEILSLPSASGAILVDRLIESLEFDIDTSIQSDAKF
jgi:integral membrane sensor domain MASE1